MVMTKMGILDEEIYSTELDDDYYQLNINYNRGPIITLTSNEVAWLFGTNVSTIEEWCTEGVLKPCSGTENGGKRFWREDI